MLKTLRLGVLSLCLVGVSVQAEPGFGGGGHGGGGYPGHGGGGGYPGGGFGNSSDRRDRQDLQSALRELEEARRSVQTANLRRTENALQMAMNLVTRVRPDQALRRAEIAIRQALRMVDARGNFDFRIQQPLMRQIQEAMQFIRQSDVFRGGGAGNPGPFPPGNGNGNGLVACVAVPVGAGPYAGRAYRVEGLIESIVRLRAKMQCERDFRHCDTHCN